MPDIDINYQGIKSLIDGLDPSKAPGPDNISPRLLKLIPNESANFLEIIFKCSLSTAEIPDDWRMANITPLYKKGNKSDPSNYRPVSLTSIPCKLLEHIIKSSVYRHLEQHNLITEKQHGSGNTSPARRNYYLLFIIYAKQLTPKAKLTLFSSISQKPLIKFHITNFYRN